MQLQFPLDLFTAQLYFLNGRSVVKSDIFQFQGNSIVRIPISLSRPGYFLARILKSDGQLVGVTPFVY